VGGGRFGRERGGVESGGYTVNTDSPWVVLGFFVIVFLVTALVKIYG